MLVNVDLLDGLALEHEGEYYALTVDGGRLEVRDLFTGVRASSTATECAIIKRVIDYITKNQAQITANTD